MKIKLWDENDYLVDEFNSLDNCVSFIDGYHEDNRSHFTIEVIDNKFSLLITRDQLHTTVNYEKVRAEK
jgi:hypothetical protein